MTVDTYAPTDTSSIVDTDTTYALRNIGIELEYPIANDAGRAPATTGLSSSQLRDEWRNEEGRDWKLPGFGPSAGSMDSDHVGAEITSGILDLHSDQPERWYNESIRQAQNFGYPFAACGQGDTNFGCHYHLSELPEEGAETINDITSNTDWGRVFFCGSVTEHTLDPWRHGGAHGMPTNSCYSRPSRAGYGDHYEFRLPEPVHPEHFGLIMDFLRMIARREYDRAYDFAYETVMSCDERLTPVKQYNAYDERLDDWPTEECFDDETRRNDPHAAEYFYDLMA